MKPHPIDIKAYIGSDPVQTLEVLMSDASPIRDIGSGGPHYIFEPKNWPEPTNTAESPLMSYSPFDGELVYILGEKSLEQRALKEIGFMPKSEFDFTCSDVIMTRREEDLLVKIVRHLITKDQLFFMIGWTDILGSEPIFVGGYHPEKKEVYSQGTTQALPNGLRTLPVSSSSFPYGHSNRSADA